MDLAEGLLEGGGYPAIRNDGYVYIQCPDRFHSFEELWPDLLDKLKFAFGESVAWGSYDIMNPMTLSAQDMFSHIERVMEMFNRHPIAHESLRRYLDLNDTPFRVSREGDFVLRVHSMPKDSALKRCYQVLFLHLLRRHIPLKYATRESFLSNHPTLGDRVDAELTVLQSIAEWFNLAFYTLSPKNNKGHFLMTIPKIVEGHHARYVTGSLQTVQTSDRVGIFRVEGSHPVQERTAQNLQQHKRSRRRHGDDDDSSAWGDSSSMSGSHSSSASVLSRGSGRYSTHSSDLTVSRANRSPTDCYHLAVRSASELDLTDADTSSHSNRHSIRYHASAVADPSRSAYSSASTVSSTGTSGSYGASWRSRLSSSSSSSSGAFSLVDGGGYPVELLEMHHSGLVPGSECFAWDSAFRVIPSSSQQSAFRMQTSEEGEGVDHHMAADVLSSLSSSRR